MFYVLNLKLNSIFDIMKRPKDILSQPYHIQEYIKYLERKKYSLNSGLSLIVYNACLNIVDK